MQFELDEDRALLKSSTRELLEKESPLADARGLMEDSAEGFSKSLYAQLGELGYFGLLLPEEAGGMGELAFAAVLEEMGRVAMPGPFLEAAVAALLLHDRRDAAGDFADRAGSGDAIVVLATRESAGPEEPGAAPAAHFEGGRVRGAKQFVPFGAQADALLVTTAEGLCLVPRPGDGFRSAAQPTLDHAQRFVEVDLDCEATLLAPGARGIQLVRKAERLGALGASALLLGLMEQSLLLTQGYLTEREAFGKPIGAFQALQHRCADMLLQTESTRSAVYRAAWAAENTPDEAPYLIAVAKAWAGPAARLVCGETIQMHGGVGFTWEYDPHIFLKRAKTLEQFHGATRDQLEAALHARGL